MMQSVEGKNAAGIGLPAFAPSGSARRRNRNLALGAFVVLGLTLIFFLLFLNRFAGIRTANGSVAAGRFILAGQVPYRDFFAAAPPLHFLISAVVVRLFGSALIVGRMFGLFERIILALTLYFWLVRFFRIPYAVIGAVVAITVSAANEGDTISSYGHESILFAVCCGLFAGIFLDRRRHRTAWVFALASGIFAGLCLSTKQTIGLGISGAIPFVVAVSVWRSGSARAAMGFIFWFVVGWAIPVGMICAWLLHEHALAQYVTQAFIRGPSAKGGSPLDFVVRWIFFTWVWRALRIGFFSSIVILLILSPALAKIRPCREKLNGIRPLLWVFVVGVLAIVAGSLVARDGSLADGIGFMMWTLSVLRTSIYFVLYATGLLVFVYLMGLTKRKPTDYESHFLLLSTVSFVIAFMLSLSFPAYEMMIIPGIGFLIAALLESGSKWCRYLCYGCSAALLVAVTVAKLEEPFGFADMIEPPVRTATVRSELPELRGLRLPESTMKLLEGATRIIREHSRPDEGIVTFPSMPVFHALTGRRLATFAGDHNIDYCPEYIAEMDAKTILREKPAVIIYYPQDPHRITAEEFIYRMGKRSAQRDIIAAIEKLASEYKLAATFDIPSRDTFGTATNHVKIYVRE